MIYDEFYGYVHHPFIEHRGTLSWLVVLYWYSIHKEEK
jgi:hypothetical protein